MKKVVIYTNDTCPYCKQVKEKLNEEKIEFEIRKTKDFKQEFQQMVDLVGLSTVPTILYKNNYLVPNRDFGNPDGLVHILKNFEESSFSESRQALEKVKTLNQNMIMAFHRVDQLLKQIETKINTDEHKSTS